MAYCFYLGGVVESNGIIIFGGSSVGFGTIQGVIDVDSLKEIVQCYFNGILEKIGIGNYGWWIQARWSKEIFIQTNYRNCRKFTAIKIKSFLGDFRIPWI